MSDELLARLSGVPVVLGPPKTGDHVRVTLTHQVGDQAPVGYRSGMALCGVRVWLADHVTDGPLTCRTCIRGRTLLERVRTLRETQQGGSDE